MDYTAKVQQIKTDISKLLRYGQHRLAYNTLIKTLNEVAKPVLISYNTRVYQIGIYLFNIDYNHNTRSCTIRLKPLKYQKLKIKWVTEINYYK